MSKYCSRVGAIGLVDAWKVTCRGNHPPWIEAELRALSPTVSRSRAKEYRVYREETGHWGVVAVGDWIIRSPRGLFTAVSPEHFFRFYEAS